MAAFVMLSAVLLGLLLPFSMADGKNTLISGETLEPGKFLTEGEFAFIMKSDCNLTLYHNDKSIWSSNTGGQGNNCSALLLDNGRFIIKGLNENGIPIVIWEIPINGPEGKYILVVQGDGHVIIYGPDRWTIPEEPKNRKKIAMVTKT